MSVENNVFISNLSCSLNLISGGGERKLETLLRKSSGSLDNRD